MQLVAKCKDECSRRSQRETSPLRRIHPGKFPGTNLCSGWLAAFVLKHVGNILHWTNGLGNGRRRFGSHRVSFQPTLSVIASSTVFRVSGLLSCLLFVTVSLRNAANALQLSRRAPVPLKSLLVKDLGSLSLSVSDVQLSKRKMMPLLLQSTINFACVCAPQELRAWENRSTNGVWSLSPPGWRSSFQGHQGLCHDCRRFDYSPSGLLVTPPVSRWWPYSTALALRPASRVAQAVLKRTWQTAQAVLTFSLLHLSLVLCFASSALS